MGSDIQLPFNRKHFFKRSLFLILFFTITPLAIVTSSISLIAISKSSNHKNQINKLNQILSIQSGSQIFASLPSNFPSVSGEVIEDDARPQLIHEYLKEYDSPLMPFADYIVHTADKYNIDYRLITAIAQQESNLCKRIPPQSYNCWGWGIHSKGTLFFSSFKEGIDTVSKGLKEEYIDKGYSNPNEIMKKYTPSSPGTWARGVNLFMDDIR